MKAVLAWDEISLILFRMKDVIPFEEKKRLITSLSLSPLIFLNHFFQEKGDESLRGATVINLHIIFQYSNTKNAQKI